MSQTASLINICRQAEIPASPYQAEGRPAGPAEEMNSSPAHGLSLPATSDIEADFPHLKPRVTRITGESRTSKRAGRAYWLVRRSPLALVSESGPLLARSRASSSR